MCTIIKDKNGNCLQGLLVTSRQELKSLLLRSLLTIKISVKKGLFFF